MESTILESLGNFGDFISGIAVVFTIGYLAIQIRQNTAALRAQSRGEIVQSYREYNQHFIKDPSLDDIFLKGLQSYPDMDHRDRRRFCTIAIDLTLAYQRSLALFESGSLDKETFRAYGDHFAKVIATPGGSVFWEESRGDFPSHVVATVEARVAAGGLTDFLTHPTFALPPENDENER